MVYTHPIDGFCWSLDGSYCWVYHRKTYWKPLVQEPFPDVYDMVKIGSVKKTKQVNPPNSVSKLIYLESPPKMSPKL